MLIHKVQFIGLQSIVQEQFFFGGGAKIFLLDFCVIF